MFCKCGEWVECGKNVTSIKCSGCSDIIYDIPIQKFPTRELSPNQYYLLVANNGFLLLTKFKPEAKIINDWKGIIFSGIVDRNKHSIHYEINGGTEHTEKLKNIPVSKPYSNKLAFDFQTLKNPGHLHKVSIENNNKFKPQTL